MDTISKIFCRSPFASLRLQAEAAQAFLVQIEPLYRATRSGDAEETKRIDARLLQVHSESRRASKDVHECLSPRPSASG